MIFLGSDSGSGKNFLIRPDPDPLLWFFRQCNWVLFFSRLGLNAQQIHLGSRLRNLVFFQAFNEDQCRSEEKKTCKDDRLDYTPSSGGTGCSSGHYDEEAPNLRRGVSGGIWKRLLLLVLYGNFFRYFYRDVQSSVADPDPNPDPHVFGPPGSGSTSQRIRIRILLWIRIRILLSSCKNSKKNLDSYYFVTLTFFLWKMI